jgi:hypothetical protein
MTDGPFTIEVVTLTSPNGGEEIHANSPWLVTWHIPGTVIPGQINLYLSTDGGLTYKPIEAVINPWETSFSWTPGLTKAKLKCKLKIVLRDSSGIIGTDKSNGNFRIVVP